MTEKEEAIGRHRLKVLEQHESRLVELETERDILYPEGHTRHAKQVTAYDNHAAITGRIRTAPFVAEVRLLDAQRAVTSATDRKVEAEAALATHTVEAAAQLATRQEAVDAAADNLTAAQDALEALEGP